MVARLPYLRFCLFEMYVNVVFVIRCLYSAVSLTLVKEQRFLRIYYFYFTLFIVIIIIINSFSFFLSMYRTELTQGRMVAQRFR